MKTKSVRSFKHGMIRMYLVVIAVYIFIPVLLTIIFFLGSQQHQTYQSDFFFPKHFFFGACSC